VLQNNQENYIEKKILANYNINNTKITKTTCINAKIRRKKKLWKN